MPVNDGQAVVVNAPLGVLLAIEPWNFPLYQVVRVAGPQLIAGNTLLLKHSEICPQTALALERVFLDAGAPNGVYTNVFLRIADVERVIAHPAVQGVSLTGSERAGMSVAEIAGRHLKKCVLELGGSDPFIILDLEAGGGLDGTGQMTLPRRGWVRPDKVARPRSASSSSTSSTTRSSPDSLSASGRCGWVTPPIRKRSWAHSLRTEPPPPSRLRSPMPSTKAPRSSPAEAVLPEETPSLSRQF